MGLLRFLVLAGPALLLNCQVKDANDCDFRDGQYQLTLTLDPAQPTGCGKGGNVPLTFSGKGFEETLAVISSCPPAPVTRSNNECTVSFSETACAASATATVDFTGEYTWSMDAESASGHLTTVSKPKSGAAASIACEYTLSIAR